MKFVILLLLSIVPALAFFPKHDGTVDPGIHHQRWRHDAYTKGLFHNRPFYQWRYFTLRDLASNTYYAITYGAVYSSRQHPDPEIEGVYMTFAAVTHPANGGAPVHWVRYEKFDVKELVIEGDYNLHILKNKDFTLTALNNDTFHLVGRMNHPDHTWCGGGSHSCLPPLDIQWDLKIHRIFGWYGQSDIEEEALAVGWIQWDTYAHSSEVEGTIRLGDQPPIEFTRTPRFRAYCDSNWGVGFPTGNPPINFPWGWYYTQEASENKKNEVSIIAGVGFIATNTSIMGDVEGAFADIRVGTDIHVGVRWVRFWEYSKHNHTVFATTNDGSVKRFDVTRSAWTNVTDALGTASIPLEQNVVIETTHYRLELKMRSAPTDYVRLLFPNPQERVLFSDFEGLGVQVGANIYKDGKLIRSLANNNGGVEFGYRCPIN